MHLIKDVKFFFLRYFITRKLNKLCDEIVRCTRVYEEIPKVKLAVKANIDVWKCFESTFETEINKWRKLNELKILNSLSTKDKKELSDMTTFIYLSSRLAKTAIMTYDKAYTDMNNFNFEYDRLRDAVKVMRSNQGQSDDFLIFMEETLDFIRNSHKKMSRHIRKLRVDLKIVSIISKKSRLSEKEVDQLIGFIDDKYIDLYDSLANSNIEVNNAIKSMLALLK